MAEARVEADGWPMPVANALKTVRPFLAALVALGLAAGLAVKLAGLGDWSPAIWAAVTVPVLLALVAEIVTSLRRGDLGLDIVAALSMTGALAVGETLAATIVALMYAGGQYLESYAERAARREMTALLSRVPRTAIRHRDGRLEEVALELIAPGDRLLVRRGDVVPVDGTVAEGLAVLDQSALTGESLPVQLRAGDSVLSGSTNVGDAFDLTATRLAAESTYAGVDSPGRGRPALARADVAACRPLRHRLPGGDGGARRRGLAHDRRPGSGGGGAGGGDALSADPGGAGGDRRRPVARGQARHSDQGRQGDRDAGADPFHRARQDRYADPRPGADRVRPARRTASRPTKLLRIAASLDQASKHIIAQTIVAEARGKGLALAIPTEVVETPGEGIAGRVDGRAVAVGGLHYVAGIIGDAASALLPGERPPGALAIAVAVDGRLAGVLVLSDDSARRHRTSAAGAARARHRTHRAGDRRPPRGGRGRRRRSADRPGALGALARRKGSHGAVGAQGTARS